MLKLLKAGVALSIFVALFFSYQIPAGVYQTYFKEAFLIIALVLTLLVMNFKSEANKKWLNISLAIFIITSMVLYFFEF
jgi:hypothetical protein